MGAFVAADTGETALQIAAVEKLIHNFRDDRAQEAVAGLVTLIVSAQEGVEMPRQALPKRR